MLYNYTNDSFAHFINLFVFIYIIYKLITRFLTRKINTNLYYYVKKWEERGFCSVSYRMVESIS